ncbi:MAG TPA: hypothetical protein VID27_04320 [Blastocatellia bacterium]
MKKQIILAMAILSFVAAASLSAFAQARRLTAEIPFNFTIKERALPAGHYTLEAIRLAGSDALRIQSADGRITATVFVRAELRESSKEEPRLVFNRYGDQYFLAEVAGFERRTVQELTRSKKEDHLAKNADAARVTVQASKAR